MISFNKLKKGQGLPLNTIVLAILVIIVLLVIIVFFTSKMGETSKQLDGNTKITECSTNNIAIKSLGYTDASYDRSDSNGKCEGKYTKLSIVPNKKDDEGKSTKIVCCAIK